MATMAFVAPALPGGAEALRRLAEEIQGPRSEEHEGFHQRVGCRRESWYLQPTPQGEMVIVYLESDDFPRTFQELAGSENPYDRWFKEQVKAVHGIDFNQPPAFMPETVYESPGP